MRITWVTRSFLDYRIPLFSALANNSDVEFQLLTSCEDVATPVAVRQKAKDVLGTKVKFLMGERCFGKPYSAEQRSNSVRRIFWQPNLRREILATHPNVVITDAFNHWTLPVLWLRTHHHFRHILCYERTEYTERNAPWLKLKFLSVMRHWIDAVHYNGILCHDFLRKLDYPEDKLKAGNLTADISGISVARKALPEAASRALKEKFGLSNEMVFLYIGALIPRKGLAQFLGAWQQFQAGKPVKLLLVGKGPQEEELKEFCRQASMDSVVFAGPCGYSDIVAYHSISDVFVIPTLEDNWSLVVPEAMASSLPVMTSCYNGCYPELVKTDNGWVFDPYDAISMVNALKDVWTKRAQLKMMGAHSLEIAMQFTPEIIARRFYDTCLELKEKQ